MPVGVRPPCTYSSHCELASMASALLPGWPSGQQQRVGHRAVRRDAARVDSDDQALVAERRGCRRERVRVLDGGRVHRHLVRAGVEQPPYVLDGADAPADGEGDEHLLRHVFHHVDDRLAPVRACGDVEEDELVRALAVVEGGELDGVPGVAQIDEGRALDDAPAGDVQARDDALGEHGPNRIPDARRERGVTTGSRFGICPGSPAPPVGPGVRR